MRNTRAQVKHQHPTALAANREPIDAFPNWSPERVALRMHSDRDDGSSYDGAAAIAPPDADDTRRGTRPHKAPIKGGHRPRQLPWTG